jgi:hypothetical protein
VPDVGYNSTALQIYQGDSTMPDMDHHTRQSLETISFLSETIGGRGSCTPAERRAAVYVAAEMQAMGIRNVRIEPYRGAPSTYRPYALAFGVALLGTILVWGFGARWLTALAAAFSALGAWGMLAETDFSANWMRWLLPSADSQNAVGIIPPARETGQRAVLCAHVDTHRTPIFYASPTWHALFGILVGAAFVSMAAGALAYALAAILGWSWIRWFGLVTGAVQLFAVALCLHADATPFSPGANDNASGVAVCLDLARRLLAGPLAHTEVWLVFTGCEEVASYGVAAFLDAHAADLGDDALYVIADQVGLGRLGYLTADGLILKRRTHPRALALARQVAAGLGDVGVEERVGIAYTDAAVATKRGLVALTLVALPPAGADETAHWHQMSDTMDSIDPQALAETHAFVWQLLQEVDRGDVGR